MVDREIERRKIIAQQIAKKIIDESGIINICIADLADQIIGGFDQLENLNQSYNKFYYQSYVNLNSSKACDDCKKAIPAHSIIYWLGYGEPVVCEDCFVKRRGI